MVARLVLLKTAKSITDPLTRHSLNELYYLTKKRETELIRLGYEYVCLWEHEFREQLQNNKEMKEYVSGIDITDRLNPRDAFFGGRTNALKLYHECTEPGETIEYFDFTRYMWLKMFLYIYIYMNFCSAYQLFGL